MLGVLALCFLLAWASVSQGATYWAAPTATGDGSGRDSSNAMTIAHYFQTGIGAAGDTINLLDGTYHGYMISVNGSPTGTAGNPITFQAVNDGKVYFDGQNTDNTVFLSNNGYYTILGIDAGQSVDVPLNLYSNSHHNVIKRSCFFNAAHPTAGFYSNLHVIGFTHSHDNLLEDLCGFGWGRNSFIPFEDTTKNNVVRRVWLRWDGWPDGAGATCPGGTIQAQYYTFHTNDIYENFISIFSGYLYPTLYTGPSDPNHFDGYPCSSLGAGWGTRQGMLDSPADGGTTAGPTWAGFIQYGYPDHNDILANGNGIGFSSRWGQTHLRDIFVDDRAARSGATIGGQYACDLPDPVDADHNLPRPGPCSQVHQDRFTYIRNSDHQATILSPAGADATNLNECTSLSACPNIYTGTTPGVGSRACFQYQNGILTNTPLWPWPMDDRIKQALGPTRANSGVLLTGSAGTGYAAGTVTSEIVARYGPIPAQCMAGGGPPPPPSPTAWWKFDENTGTTATDSLQGHIFTLSANVGWAPGKVGVSSLRCSSNTSPVTAEIVFDDPTYTWSAWVKGDTAPSNTVFTAPISDGPSAGPAWGLWWSSQDAPLMTNTQSIFHIDSGGLHLLKIPGTLAANVWYHLAATYNGALLQLYLNGQLQGSMAVGTPITPTGPLQVCGRNCCPAPWAGTLDELRVDNRAWTAAEVLTEYQRGVQVAGHAKHRVLGQ